MSSEVIVVPDLGGAEEVEVIEVSVAVGDTVEIDQTLVVLESDKAMMEIPAPVAGKITKLFVKEEDKIEKEGDQLVEMEISATNASTLDKANSESQSEADIEPVTEPPAEKADSAGNASDVVTTDSTASTEIPTTSVAPSLDSEAAPTVQKSSPGSNDAAAVADTSNIDVQKDDDSSESIYAGPATRQLARELGVNLAGITGTGPRGRLLKEDVQAYVKKQISSKTGGAGNLSGGSGIPSVPDIDFSQFGDIEQIKMSKIARLTAANMHRSWLNVPHVTQFDDADITELEAFRQSLKPEGEARGEKMTPVPIILKACAVALTNNPVLNRSLHSDGEHYIQKHYINIGLAVDTPRGLVVPVVRDVVSKTLWQLAAEVAELAAKARDGKLTANEMQGGCFTVSSLGAIGGNGFTPLVNTPQVAILGVSKAQIKPVWNGTEFVPRNMLPLSLSYDHRIVNGGDAGRFTTDLVALLGDIRRFLL